MTDQEMNARIEIAKAFLHDFIDRSTHLKMFGPQDSNEWLRSIGFYDDGAIILSEAHNRWRSALGMGPKLKEYRFFHQRRLLPIGFRVMDHAQFAEYEKLLGLL